MILYHSTATPTAHLVLEALAYFVGARIYWIAARRLPLPPRKADRLVLLGFAVFGAAVGSKLLHVAEHLDYLVRQGTLTDWLAGKSILGGFIGGTLGVELAKRMIRWPRSTGDAWVPALAVGLVIGRLGCQLSGTWDQTYGTATSLRWGWDYGDGVARHPVAGYEMLLVAGLWWLVQGRWVSFPGARFAAFLAGYCLIRLGLDFLKPPFGAVAAGAMPVSVVLGLTAIQWAALAGLVGYALLLRRRLQPGPVSQPAF